MRRWIWPCHSVTWAVRNPRSQAEASRVSSFPRRLVSVPHLFQGQGATVTALGPDTTGEKSPGLLSSWLEGNKCALKGLKGAARPPVRTAQYHSHVRRILSWCQRSLRFRIILAIRRQMSHFGYWTGASLEGDHAQDNPHRIIYL